MTVDAISDFLKKPYYGQNISIKSYAALSELNENCVTFAKECSAYSKNILSLNKNILAIVTPDFIKKIECTYIVSDNPRLDYLRVIKKFFITEVPTTGIHKSSVIEDGAIIGRNPSIGAHCYIGSDVVIGNKANIHHNVVITGKVTIGENCVIKSGAIIGEEGFGFEINENGVPEHFPHTGKIIIGNNVFIGSNSSIERGTIGSTTICDNVKIDDLSQIGHNTYTGENTLITAGSIVCGGAIIDKNCYIAPNVTIRQRIKVNENSFVGMGAVVVKDVLPGKTVIGNPAQEYKKHE